MLVQIDQEGLTLPERSLYLGQDEDSTKVSFLPLLPPTSIPPLFLLHSFSLPLITSLILLPFTGLNFIIISSHLLFDPTIACLLASLFSPSYIIFFFCFLFHFSLPPSLPLSPLSPIFSPSVLSSFSPPPICPIDSSFALLHPSTCFPLSPTVVLLCCPLCHMSPPSPDIIDDVSAAPPVY